MSVGGGMRRVVVSGLTVMALAAGLAGCSSVPAGSGASDSDPTASTAAEGQDNLTREPYTFYVTLPNKNQVFCVGVNGYYDDSPSITCDWANVQRLNKNYVG